MATLVNDYFNLLPAQADTINVPKYFYKNAADTKGKQVGNTFIDNSHALFDASMKGGLIEFASNADGVGYSYSAMILDVPTATTLTLDVSQNINATDYTIWYGGIQMNQNGYLSFTQLINNGLSVNAVVTKDITITAANLLGGAAVVIMPAINSATSYKVRDVKVNYSATGLGGGGGNRLLSITDNVTIYNAGGITTALLANPINTIWSGTGNPLPSTVAVSTPTAAGFNLNATYIGGTTDYTTGSVTLSVTVERVA